MDDPAPDLGLDPALIDTLLAQHGIRDPWTPLPATGVANRIYATKDAVLRVATDHPQAVPDARTESVAAPVAWAAGIRTPRLIAFDDSRALVDRPYSLWERVHGETLGLLALDEARRARAWREVGRELARLHDRVRVCPDPDGYLDAPGRPLDLLAHLDRLRGAGVIDRVSATETASLIHELAPHVTAPTAIRFLHDDVHAWNVMCTPDGELLALIDWGDAGWGDPTLDFAYVPLELIPHVVAGYESESSTGLGPWAGARFVWDKLHSVLQGLGEGREVTFRVDGFRRFLDTEAWQAAAAPDSPD